MPFPGAYALITQVLSIEYPVSIIINHAKNNIYTTAVTNMTGTEIAENWIIKPMELGRAFVLSDKLFETFNKK
jgi:hypothetical protein